MSFKGKMAVLGHKINDKSPEILLAGAIISLGGALFFACKGTTKASGIIDEHKEKMSDVNKLLAKKVSDDPEYRDDDYDENDARRDKFIITTQTGIKLLREYAPAIIFTTLSVTCMLGSYKILHKRYVGASALAASLYKTLSSYRGRVAEEIGKEAEEHLFNNTKYAEITEDKGDGKGAKTKKAEILDDANGIPITSKFFDDACRAWTKDPSTNLMYLRGVQARANDIFKDRGMLMLNEVYAMLDIPITHASCEAGWFKDHGDQFVDFGLSNFDEDRVRAFINGFEPYILLNFNCVPKFNEDLGLY